MIKYRSLSEQEKKQVREKIIVMYLQELKSMNEIARELHLSTGTVDWLLFQMNVPVRTNREGLVLYNAKKKVQEGQMELLP